MPGGKGANVSSLAWRPLETLGDPWTSPLGQNGLNFDNQGHRHISKSMFLWTGID
jgi:hypothetical protein